jgi:hypothetical protein
LKIEACHFLPEHITENQFEFVTCEVMAKSSMSVSPKEREHRCGENLSAVLAEQLIVSITVLQYSLLTCPPFQYPVGDNNCDQ